jgi:6-phosphofructokinase 1
MEGRRAGTRYEIIIVAEGAKEIGGTEIVKKEGVDSFGHKALGGVGQFVAEEIQKGTGLETRSVTLSHLQRGGAPSSYDRRMGRYYGIAAIDLVVKEDYGKMVCLKEGDISSTPLETIYGKLNRVDPDIEYDKDRYNGRRTIIS